MSNDSGFWLRFNLDGSPHICKSIEKKAEEFIKSKPEKPKTTPTLKDLDERVERIEKIIEALYEDKK